MNTVGLRVAPAPRFFHSRDSRLSDNPTFRAPFFGHRLLGDSFTLPTGDLFSHHPRRCGMMESVFSVRLTSYFQPGVAPRLTARPEGPERLSCPEARTSIMLFSDFPFCPRHPQQNFIS